MLKFFRIPANSRSLSFSPLPSRGYRISGKEVEVHGSGPWHHQLCGCHNLQLIQSHVAPSHGPPARVLSPLFFLAKFFLLPKPCDKREHPLKLRGPNSCPSCVVPNYSAKAAWSSSIGLPRLGPVFLCSPISNSSHNQLHLPAFTYSSNFTGLP